MPNDETNRLSKRLGRYTRVGVAGSKLAARAAGSKVGIGSSDRDEAAAALKAALGNLRGPLMKVAQLLATIPGALPREYARELAELQNNAPSMGWPFVRRRMAAELGPDWQDKFQDFPRDAAHAASLGQVHKATAKDGTLLACKLQYPDMDSIIAADLKQLKLILGIYQRFDKAVDTSHVYEEIRERLYEELDYKREAKACQLYEAMLGDQKHIYVPKVYPDLCGGRLLSASWLDGAPISNFFESDQNTRNQIALNLFHAWYVPLYRYGIIHGDPHPGNYTVRDDLSINLLDFGCIRIFKSKFIWGVLELYHALKTDNRERAVSAYESWGFTGLSNELIDTLNIWAHFLYGPVLDEKERVIGELSETGVYGREIASKVHAELKRLGGVTIPREFVFMDRAALGLGSIFIRLRAKINWADLFQKLTEDFKEEDLTMRQKGLKGIDALI